MTRQPPVCASAGRQFVAVIKPVSFSPQNGPVTGDGLGVTGNGMVGDCEVATEAHAYACGGLFASTQPRPLADSGVIPLRPASTFPRPLVSQAGLADFDCAHACDRHYCLHCNYDASHLQLVSPHCTGIPRAMNWDALVTDPGAFKSDVEPFAGIICSGWDSRGGL